MSKDMNYYVSSEMFMVDDNDVPEWITVYRNGVPIWEKLLEDDFGLYVMNQNNEKDYVFEK